MRLRFDYWTSTEREKEFIGWNGEEITPHLLTPSPKGKGELESPSRVGLFYFPLTGYSPWILKQTVGWLFQ